MSITALDIGSHSIKVVVTKSNKQRTIEKALEVSNPLGLIIPQTDREVAQFTELMANVFHDYKLSQSDVRLSLPEYMVSCKVIEVPMLTDAELASAVGWQAEQVIPIPKDDLSLQYQVLWKPDNKQPEAKMKVLLVGAKRSLVERLNNVFLDLGIEASLLETQLFALIRSLDIHDDDPESIILQMGASSSDIAVVANGLFAFSFSSKNGSQLLNAAIAQSFNLDDAQAESYKCQYGLNPNELEGKLFQVLRPMLDGLVQDLQKTMRFFSQTHPGQTIKRIVTAGGPAAMIGLNEHLSQSLGVEVVTCAPFAQAHGQVPQQNQLSFAVSMGLVAREF